MTIADIAHWIERIDDERLDEPLDEEPALYVHPCLLTAPQDAAYDEGTP